MGTAGLRIELPPVPTSAATARRFVADALDATADEQRDIGVLLTSELVTNALLYASGGITLQVEPKAAAYRVSVADSSHVDLRPRAVGPEATSGRGLALVEELSASWGVELVPDDGKLVWFEVPRSA